MLPSLNLSFVCEKIKHHTTGRKQKFMKLSEMPRVTHQCVAAPGMETLNPALFLTDALFTPIRLLPLNVALLPQTDFTLNSLWGS